MPDKYYSRGTEWHPYLLDILKVDENTVLIGHGTAGACIMRLLEDHKLRGAVLVGAASTDRNIELDRRSQYYNAKFDWECIKKNTGKFGIVQIHSPNDKLVPLENAKYFHEELKTAWREVDKRGNFRQPTLPELVEEIETAHANGEFPTDD